MMNVRQKNESIRITFDDPSLPSNIDYLLVKPARNWSTTFSAWGKKVDSPIVKVGTRTFRVVLEEV